MELDDNQEAAWRDCVDRFRHKDRGKLVMARGSKVELERPLAGLVLGCARSET